MHESTSQPALPEPAATIGMPPTEPPDVGSLHRLSEELSRLGEAAEQDGLMAPSVNSREQRFQNHLVEARLGSAAGLFAALRAKHPATANHCLRVALVCSGWANASHLSTAQRNTLEVAALLHDVGKIGVPDAVLTKPGRLLPEEAATMRHSRQFAVEMLTAGGAPQSVIDTIFTAAAWVDGSLSDLLLTGNQIPQTARMLAIVDAFDSMTTAHVYRPARSRERALAELFNYAGRQFDAELVRSFTELVARDQTVLTDEVASHWLAELKAEQHHWPTDEAITVQQRTGDRRRENTNSLFEQKLVDNMHDGVVFVDAQRRIFLWNTGAERLTGIAGSAACGRAFAPELLQMCSIEGVPIPGNQCPTTRTIRGGMQSFDRIDILGRSGRRVTVDMHVIPVHDDQGSPCGATVLLQDVSSETSLEERCQALHAQTTKDPLTQVANRAEFDRMLTQFVEAHQETSLTCSLIMTDIDFFKHINDTYGHQAGDEAIVAFASLLKSMCRSGDLVARYGGEEFAILCADCNNATASARAEAMRKRLANTACPSLGGQRITASFGVTELQPGDTPASMLRRSDRALLQAKDQGRNQVVQLGNGMLEDKPKTRWFSFRTWKGGSLIESRLLTNVPIELAIEKLRGFISDREARILHVNDEEVKLEVTESTRHKRGGTHPVTYVLQIKFNQQRETKVNTAGLAAGDYVCTLANVTIQLKHQRDRRNAHVVDQARRLLGNLKSYLMAKESVAEVTSDTEPIAAD